MTYEVQGGRWLALPITVVSAVASFALPLCHQTLEHGVPGAYARDTFPSAIAVQLRPAEVCPVDPAPRRLARPLRLRRFWGRQSSDTAAIRGRVDMDFGAGWVDVSEDVVSTVKASWGIGGGGPASRTADAGVMSFDLNDSNTNSGGARGYYSPDDPDVRAGFRLGTPARLVLTHPTLGSITRWEGRVSRVTPHPGVASPIASIECTDWLQEAALAPLSGLAVRVGIQSDFLFAALVDAVATPPPNGTRTRAPADIYPFALDQTQDENARVLGEIAKLAASEFGQVYVSAGTAVFEGRRWRGVVRDALYRVDEDVQLLAATVTAHDKDQVLNRTQVTVHPRARDQFNDTELFRLASALKIPAGTTVAINCPYKDPKQRAQRAAGVDMRDPIVTFNAAADGTGADLTDQVEASAAFGGNTATVTVTNNGPGDGFLPPGGLLLQGRGLYDYDPILAEARDGDSVALYGENRLGYDMPYQGAPDIARELASYFLHLYKAPRTRVSTVRWLANWDWEAARSAFLLEISDRLMVHAPSVGCEDVEHFINGLQLEVQTCGLVMITALLEEVDPTLYWHVGRQGQSEVEETTILGFAAFFPGWWLGVEGYSELSRNTFLNRGVS